MVSQIHRRFTDDQVKLLLELYSKRAIPLEQVLRQLECSSSRFYQILKAYRRDPGEFTVAYGRDYLQHRLSKKIERGIREELEMDRQLIGDKETPLWGYSYAAVRDEIARRLGCRVSAQTVHSRAKEWGFYIPNIKKEKSPPREVVTEAAGMLLQHDSLYHIDPRGLVIGIVILNH